MIELFAAIICSVLVSVLLKIARRNHLLIQQAIAVNYLVAASCAYLFLQPDLGGVLDSPQQGLLLLALGVLLPVIFVIMGKAVDSAGIVKSDAAQRLSLFLPILAAFVVFGEALSLNKSVGILLAFLALSALLYQPANTLHAPKKPNNTAARLLLAVWAGYGIIDILFKQLSKIGQAFSATLLAAFILAGLLSFAYLLMRRTRWHLPSLLSGVLLGCLNFGNIVFYIRAHQVYGSNPTLVFAGMNLGVIVLGTLIGALVFREKINKINVLGIVLALAAIVCLFYFDAIRRLAVWFS
ncbi:hypothetical protein [Stenoxybacter acetivorans]|uniref:hypothetical protein n=1 Tax=Stenoxybacter acetivorans TaxID=422441 RepID=UPI000568F4B6|nr:hypothetical protein [Stenoxybacter acetivorans]